MLFLLFLLLIAAVLGILGAVVKVTLILVLSGVLSIVLLGAIASFWWRRKVREIRRNMRIDVRGSVWPGPGTPGEELPKG